MGKSTLMLLWLFLTLGSVAAQADKVERALPNWLMGIISVVVFLCVVFITFLVNKVWCNTSKPEDVFSNEYTMTNGSPSYETSLDAVRYIHLHYCLNQRFSNWGPSFLNMSFQTAIVDLVFRSGDDLNAYENVIAQQTDEKVTAM
ncbi:PDZK1-interacting protein 1 [Triplophysa rosa]|uniref:PDZK1-interacting protein 1 n=1 Tax=Triplophysa rosa TaxID=992332 RepID=UPI00254638BC|nr:PDZK1-interacting protein 1 [Triplophysa rosa]